MTWEVTTHEVELEAGEQSTLRLENYQDYREGQEIVDQPTLLVVESLSEEADSFEVLLDAPGEMDRSEPGRAYQAFWGTVQRGNALVIGLRAQVAGRFRISIMRLRSRFGQWWNNLPCNICKDVVKILVAALLANFGVPLLTDAGNLASTTSTTSLANVHGSGIWNWIVGNQLEPLAAQIFGGLYIVLGQLQQTMNWLYEMPCRAVNFCP